MNIKSVFQYLYFRVRPPIITISTGLMPTDNGMFLVRLGWQRSDSQVIVMIHYVADGSDEMELVLAGNVMESAEGEPVTASREDLVKYKDVIVQAVLKVLVPKLQEFLKETGREIVFETPEDGLEEKIAV